MKKEEILAQDQSTPEEIADKVRKERLSLYKIKRAQEDPGFHFNEVEVEIDGQKRKRTSYSLFEKQYDTPEEHKQAVDLLEATLHAATGTSSYKYGLGLLEQTVRALFGFSDKAKDAYNNALDAMISMQPKDLIEGQLCSRLIILTNQINEYMKCAALVEHPLAQERYINQATKLSRVYNETLAALEKYRRKGEQRVVVQHVNVENGGQAVVTGNLNSGGTHGKKDQESLQ